MKTNTKNNGIMPICCLFGIIGIAILLAILEGMKFIPSPMQLF